MRATGIVRRIDDLGRVVIPKEVRRTMMIAEGDPLEIFIDGDMVCFKKYITEDNYISTIKSMIDNLSDDEGIDNNKRKILIEHYY